MRFLLAVGVLLFSAACGPAIRLCGGVQCTANSECIDTEDGEVCRCAEGYVDRAARCHPEGPCGRLATVLCRATGETGAVCAALHEGVVTADGATCERRLAEADLQQDIDWIGAVEPMLARGAPAAYRTLLTRSMLDPCGAATELLCVVMRPGERRCGEQAAAATRDEQSCRQVVRGYDALLMAGDAPPPDEAAGSDAVVGTDVLVHLIPDPGNRGAMPPNRFRAALVAEREEIEACYAGARGTFPGLSGRAVFLVRVAADGSAAAELGRGDGPIVGSGVAECVRGVLSRLDFADAPPEGGSFDVHVSLDFGR